MCNVCDNKGLLARLFSPKTKHDYYWCVVYGVDNHGRHLAYAPICLRCSTIEFDHPMFDWVKAKLTLGTPLKPIEGPDFSLEILMRKRDAS